MVRWRWKRTPPPGFTDEWWYAALVPRADVDKRGVPTTKAPFTLTELLMAFTEEQLGGNLCDAIINLDKDIQSTSYVSADGFTVIRIRLRLPTIDRTRSSTVVWSAREPVDLCLQEAGVRLLILASSSSSTKKDKS